MQKRCWQYLVSEPEVWNNFLACSIWDLNGQASQSINLLSYHDGATNCWPDHRLFLPELSGASRSRGKQKPRWGKRSLVLEFSTRPSVLAPALASVHGISFVELSLALGRPLFVAFFLEETIDAVGKLWGLGRQLRFAPRRNSIQWACCQRHLGQAL